VCVGLVQRSGKGRREGLPCRQTGAKEMWFFRLEICRQEIILVEVFRGEIKCYCQR
jgi:hypothetical protein